MTKTLLLAAVGTLALIVNPSLGCDAPEPEFLYDAADMRIAIEGTWKLHIAGKPELTLTIRQSANAERHAERATLVRSASACSERTFVRSAGACLDTSEMPLDVEVAGMTTKRRPTGVFLVWDSVFVVGDLHITLDDIEVDAKITPTGTVEEASASRGMDLIAATLARVR